MSLAEAAKCIQSDVVVISAVEWHELSTPSSSRTGARNPKFPLHEGARDNSTWLLKSIRLAFGNVRTGLLSFQTARARSAAVVQSWSERRDAWANPMEWWQDSKLKSNNCGSASSDPNRSDAVLARDV